MKKTLLVTIDFPPDMGGVATYWKNVSLDMPSDKLVVLTVGKTNQSDNCYKCRVIRKNLFFCFFWPKWIRGVWHIYRVYKKEKCDQILVGQILPIGAMVFVLNKVLGVPYFVQIYGMDLLKAKQKKRKYKFAQAILKNAKIIFVNSNAIGEIVRDYSDQELESIVIYPIPKFDTNVDQKIRKDIIRKNCLNGKKVVLTVGRLVARKGQDMTIKAMDKVWKTFSDVVYVIAGDGADRQRLEKLAGKSERIIFTGGVSDQEKNAWLSVADIFCMPARQSKDDIEGFGIVYLEANSFGIPVIGGNSGGVTEAVIHNKTGVLVDPTNVEEIADLIMVLLSNVAYAKTLGQTGLNRVRNSLTWDKNIHRLIDNL